MTTNQKLLAALRKVLTEHDHGGLGGGDLAVALAEAAERVLGRPGSSMAPGETRTLIAEARERFAHAKKLSGSSSMGTPAMLLVAALVPRLADALESVLTVPDGDAREALLRLNIAGEIEAEDEASGPFPDKANAYYDGLRRAAEIVRNGR